MLMQLPFLLENRLGWPIRGEVRWLAGLGQGGLRPAAPEDAGAPPTLVLCHGFKGFKDWGHFPWVAEQLARAGFQVITFNFGGSGVDDVPDQFTRLDRFRRNTLSLEIEELELVLGALERGDLPGAAARTKAAGLIGHSRGAVATSVVAVRRGDIGALVLWAGIGVLERRYPEAVRRAWRDSGELDIVNARTGQRMPVGLEALDDLEKHLEAYSPHAVIPALHTPTLWIHGAADATIPIEEARVVDAAARGRGDQWSFVVLDEADHTFGSVHPFRGPSSHLDRAVDRTRAFFDRWLRGAGGGGK